MNKEKINIAIIGGGIAGLSLGCTLKINGIDSTVFEKSSNISNYSAGISISKNGFKIIEYLNLSNEIKSNSYQSKLIAWKYDNKIFHKMPTDTYTMERKSLFKVLYDKYIKLGGQVIFDHELKSISNNGKELLFKNSKIFTANHIASCDGIKSIVRESLFKSADPIYSGFTAWRGIGRGHNDKIEFSLGSNNHLVSYPVNNDLDRSFIGIMKTDTWSKESWKQKVSFEEFESHFISDDISAYSEFKSSDDIYKWGVFIRPQVKKMFKENITLLGDSAHPMVPFLGQGGCMSLEDSFIFGTLCHKLNLKFGDIQTLYQKLRMKRVNKIQKMSYNQARLNHIHNPLLAKIRNNLMKHTNVINRRLREIHEYDAYDDIENELSK